MVLLCMQNSENDHTVTLHPIKKFIRKATGDHTPKAIINRPAAVQRVQQESPRSA